LTPFQINILLGYSKPSAAGLVDYEPFAKSLQQNIERMFSIEALRRKAQLVQLGTFKTEEVPRPEYNDVQLFKAFRNCDENSHGFLELTEYSQCLSQFKELEFQTNEIVTLTLMCDVNGDGRIDYQEFMKHFEDQTYLIKFHQSLQNMYDEERKLQMQEDRNMMQNTTPPMGNSTLSGNNFGELGTTVKE